MENLGLNISESLEKLCKSNGKCGADLQGFLAKQVRDIFYFLELYHLNFVIDNGKIFTIIPDLNICTRKGNKNVLKHKKWHGR